MSVASSIYTCKNKDQFAISYIDDFNKIKYIPYCTTSILSKQDDGMINIHDYSDNGIYITDDDGKRFLQIYSYRYDLAEVVKMAKRSIYKLLNKVDIVHPCLVGNFDADGSYLVAYMLYNNDLDVNTKFIDRELLFNLPSIGNPNIMAVMKRIYINLTYGISFANTTKAISVKPTFSEYKKFILSDFDDYNSMIEMVEFINNNKIFKFDELCEYIKICPYRKRPNIIPDKLNLEED